jgi:hypothetical protein
MTETITETEGDWVLSSSGAKISSLLNSRLVMPCSPPKKHSAVMVTKDFFSRSGTDPKAVLLWQQVSIRQRRLVVTALFGLAPEPSARASAVNHRKKHQRLPAQWPGEPKRYGSFRN